MSKQDLIKLEINVEVGKLYKVSSKREGKEIQITIREVANE